MREQWDADHEQHVYWFEKALAALALVVGGGMAYWGSGVGSYVGAGLASIGVYMVFPNVRPMISGIVDRLPFLAKRAVPDIAPAEEEEG